MQAGPGVAEDANVGEVDEASASEPFAAPFERGA
jgi:hypothetical protein